MINLNKEQIRSLIPTCTGHIAQELEYACRAEAPFGQVKIEVYADNIAKPNTMLLIDGFAGTALHGDAGNSKSNNAIKKLIMDCFGEEGKEVWLSLYSPEWEPVVDTLFEGFTSWKAYRLVHHLDREAFQNHMNRRAKVPEGYTMARYDTSSHDFIEKRGLQDFWRPESDRFGWFLMKDGEVVSECTSVWVEKVGVERNHVEIGIETEEPYRRKGFAELTATAFIDDCLLRGLTPVWCCWDFREGSKELAEKIGFRIVESRRTVFIREK